MTQPADTTAELDEALRLLDEALAERRPLNRYHARAVLLPLGRLLASGTEKEVQTGRASLARIARATERTRATWEAALQQEVEMAVTEFLKSVDARYLSRPDYDLRYTVDARELLGDRLRALQALGLGISDAWRRRIEQADRELARVLEHRPIRGSEPSRSDELGKPGKLDRPDR